MCFFLRLPAFEVVDMDSLPGTRGITAKSAHTLVQPFLFILDNGFNRSRCAMGWPVTNGDDLWVRG